MGKKYNKNTEQNTWSRSPFIQNMKAVIRSKYFPFLGGLAAILLIFVVVKGVMILGELRSINWASGRLDYVQAQAQKDNAKDYVLTRIK